MSELCFSCPCRAAHPTCKGGGSPTDQLWQVGRDFCINGETMNNMQASVSAELLSISCPVTCELVQSEQFGLQSLTCLFRQHDGGGDLQVRWTHLYTGNILPNYTRCLLPAITCQIMGFYSSHITGNLKV